MLTNKWHRMRKDLEDKLLAATGDGTIEAGQNGTYNLDVFLGHCTGEGGPSYQQITGTKDSFAKIPSLYGSASSNTLLSFPARP